MTRWLVTGAAGRLGAVLSGRLRTRDADVVAARRAELDVTDSAAVAAAIATIRPEVVVNCAAFTAVDDAERQPAAARAINADGPANLARACSEWGARLVQISTDYVFDGAARTPYAEGAATAPLNVYGHTKLAGEHAVLENLPDAAYIVRTAWLYAEDGHSFVATMAGFAADDEARPRVVDDQWGQPTAAAVVADLVLAMVAAAPPGIYHATCSGQTSWYGLAQEVFRLAGADPARIEPVDSVAYPRPAPRPAYSVLGHGGWQGAQLPDPPDWQTALRMTLPGILASSR